MGRWVLWCSMGAGAIAVFAVTAWGYIYLTRTIPEEIRALPWAGQVREIELDAVCPSWTHGVYAVYCIKGADSISRVYWRWKGHCFESEM